MHGLENQVGVAAVVTANAHGGEGRSPPEAAAHQGAIALNHFPGKRPVAGEEVLGQREHFDFLGALPAAAEEPQVIQFAAYRRQLVRQRVPLENEVTLAGEYGEDANEEKPEEPGRIPDDGAGQGDQRNAALEQGAHHGKNRHTVRGTGRGARSSFVVEVRVFEGGQSRWRRPAALL